MFIYRKNKETSSKESNYFKVKPKFLKPKNSFFRT